MATPDSRRRPPEGWRAFAYVAALLGAWFLGDLAIHEVVGTAVNGVGRPSEAFQLMVVVLLTLLSILFVFATERLVGTSGATVLAVCILVIAAFQLVAAFAWDLGSASGVGLADDERWAEYLSQMVAMSVALPVLRSLAVRGLPRSGA